MLIFHFSQVRPWTSKVAGGGGEGGGGGGVTVDIQEAARHPVLYDNFYLVEYLLDKFIPPVIAGQLLNNI